MLCVTMFFEKASEVFQFVSRLLQGCLKGVSVVFLECLKEILGVWCTKRTGKLATISTISAISPISAIQIFPLEAESIYSEAIPTHVSNHLRAIQSYP